MTAKAQVPVAAIRAGGQLHAKGDSIKLCAPFTIAFADASTGGSNQYRWTFQNGTPATSTAKDPGNVSFTTGSVHEVKLVVQNANGKDSAFFYLNSSTEKPAPSFTFGPDNQCGNLETVFTNTTPEAVSYLWKFGDDDTSSTKNPSHSFGTITGTGTQNVPVKLIATNEFGCKDSVTQNVRVIRVPDASLRTTDMNVELVNFNGLETFRKCENQDSYVFVFKNNSSTSSTNTSYKVDWGDNTTPYEGTSFPTDLSHEYSIGNHIMTVTVKGSSGCIGVKKYNVFLGTNPAGGIITPGNTNICAPQILTFPVTGTTNNPPGTQYIVSFNDGSPSRIFTHPSPTDISHQFNISSCGYSSSNGSTNFPNSFRVTLDIENPCGISSTTAIPITVSTKPTPRIELYPDSVICPDYTATIQDISTGGSYISGSGASASCNSGSGTVWKITPATGWTRTFGTMGDLNNNISNFLEWDNGSSYLNVRFTTPGNYTVTLYKGNRCGVDSVKRVICVREQPKASFTFDKNTGCAPFTATATNTSPNPPCGSNYYYWTVTRLDPEGCASGSGAGYTYINGTSTTSEQPAWTFTRAGKYVIRLTAYAQGNSYYSCNVVEKTDTIFVAEKPSATINAAATICAGQSISPTATIRSCYSALAGDMEWEFPGGSPAVFTGSTPGAITYPSAGTYTIRLKVTNGCGATEVTRQVTVVALPTANAGSDVTICSGEPVQLGAAPVAGYTYLWDNTSNLSSQTSANPVFMAVNSSGTDVVYTLKLTVRIGSGCESEGTVRITVRSAPLLSATPSQAVICSGDSTLVELSGADSWSWSPSTGIRPEGSAGFWLKPTTTTSYSVTGTASDGCKNNLILPVTVKPLPNTEAGSNLVACLRNEEIVLGGSPSGGSWSGPGTSLSGTGYVFNPSIPGLGNHKLYYTATLNGCSLKDSTYADVIVLQSADAGNDTTICEKGPEIQLKGLPAGGSWSGSPLVTPDGRFNPSAAGTYQLIYTFGAGSCRVSDEKQITVLPGINNNTVQTKQDICVNTAPALITGSNPSGGNGNYSFQWQESPDGVSWNNIPDAIQRDLQPSVLTSTMYYRRIVVTELCYGAQSNISNTASIVVHPDAKAVFTATRTLGCVPFVLDASIVSVNSLPEQNGTYLWYANDILFASTPDATFPGYTISSENETITIKLVTRSQWGCRADSMQMDFVTVEGAAASFTQSADEGCTPLSVTFSNTSSRIAGVQHQWDFGNGQTSTQAAPGTIVFEGSPEGTDTTYYITLTISNGCTVSVHKDSVLVKPKPKAIFGVDTTIGCSPMTVRINNGSRGEPATYYWDFGNGDTDTRNNSGIFPYTYYTGIVDTFLLKMKMVNACGEDSLAINIVVVPNQIQPQVAVQGNELYGCAPHTVHFLNTTIGGSRYTWDFKDGSSILVTSSSPETVQHTFARPGTYPVQIRITNGCSDTTITREVIVADGPSAGFSLDNRPYCESTEIAFTNISLRSESYLWRFGDGQTSIEKDPVHRFSQPGKYTIELIAYNSNPFGTRCFDTMRREVEIVPRPVAALQTSIQPVNCAPFTLTASVNPAGAINANWYFDDPTQPDIGVGFLVNHTYREAGSYRLKVVALNTAGCADSAFAHFIVQATPRAGFDTKDIITCSTDTTISFKNTSTYTGNDGVSWKWLMDGVAVSTQKEHTYRFRLPSGTLLPKTYVIQLVSVNSYGCSDTATGSLRMNPTPLAGFNILNDHGCVPYTLQINNSSIFADSYQWFLDDRLVSTEARPGNILLTSASTSYRLKLVAGNIYGCRPDEIEYTVTTAPKPTALFGVPDSLSCNGILDVRMENRSEGATSYTWIFGDNTPREYTANPRHVYAQNGEYDLLLVADNGVCRDTASKIMRVGLRPSAAFESDVTTGCKQVTVNFSNLSRNAMSYTWDFGNGNYSGQKDPTHSFGIGTSPYTVKLVATGLYGCADTVSRIGFVHVKTPPTAAFKVLPSNIIEIPNYTFRFLNESDGLKTPEYQWTFGDGNRTNNPNPVYTYQDTGTFSVHLMVLNTEDGCADTAIQKVTILGIPGWLQVPNAFQPGSDRSELRTFLPKGTGLREYRLQVFNGWGELIFETTRLDEKGRPTEGWDGTYKGKPVQQDAFVWKIQAFFLNGTEWKGMKYPGKDPKKVGTITVIK